ncbi:Sodium-dependent phosphate transport protein 3 [Galemys pyrenaicus]|uniref:Sodium-dependent phosphate transport protein 3 n=1 Tax=Galemys pyrenaicus TaxID=202257 RepID=A0A8J6A9E3_GALPY|nr:Sodium-dependent phosphate transport protein 3 [Galemys pyrenaicus]
MMDICGAACMPTWECASGRTRVWTWVYKGGIMRMPAAARGYQEQQQEQQKWEEQDANSRSREKKQQSREGATVEVKKPPFPSGADAQDWTEAAQTQHLGGGFDLLPARPGRGAGTPAPECYHMVPKVETTFYSDTNCSPNPGKSAAAERRCWTVRMRWSEALVRGAAPRGWQVGHTYNTLLVATPTRPAHWSPIIKACRGKRDSGQRETPPQGPNFCSLRYGLALIMNFSNFTMITQRVSLSIAIIAMVNNTQQHGLPNASAEGPFVDTFDNPSRSIKTFSGGASVYEWSPETQGIIFSSISYGIILTLIPSGYLAGIFGAKQMLGAGLLISSLLTLVMPLAADFGVILVIVIRTVQGMAQGMAWTGQFTIWAKWAPPLERSKLTSIAGSGSAFGSFFILCVGGLISQALGWPFIFYIFGSIGCVCCLLWFTVIYDDPVHHPCISVKEKEHIVSSVAQQVQYTPPHHAETAWAGSPRRSVPIKAMFRCLPLWAIFTGFFSHFWLCTIIITYLPTYISSVLHVNIRDSGVLSSLPFIAASTCTILGGQLADFLLSRNLLRLITVRKLFSSLGLLLPSLCAVALPFVASSYMTTIILLILIPGTSNLCDSGFIINTLDVAPRYASFLMGLSRGFGLLAGIISSTATGFLISQDSVSGWRNVFFLSAAVNMLGLVFYLTFGQAEIQSWAKERPLTRL